MVNNILYINDSKKAINNIMPRIEIQKENKSKKLLRKQYVSKQSTESYEYKIAKSYSPSVSWKLNTSLTQKDTMDRGAWIKFRKKGMQED